MLDAFDEEIREEAYHVYRRRSAEGWCREPQDDWMEAVAMVMARHGVNRHLQADPSEVN